MRTLGHVHAAGDLTSELNILHRDERFLAVDKPSGMLVHRGMGWADLVLVDQVRELLGADVVHPVHRLDRGTSGVVLFALDADAARFVAYQFERGFVQKTYLALVRGEIDDELTIDHPIPRRPDGPRVHAVTHVRRLGVAETTPRHVSLVLATPETGRFHQIRRHLKHISFPVIGDTTYGKGKINRAMGNRYGLRRLALHAMSLEVRHPDGDEDMRFEAPLPLDLTEPLTRMGLAVEGIVGQQLDGGTTKPPGR